MPRFIPEKWKPEHDSSPGVWHLEPNCVVLLRRYAGDRGGCPCGCGEFPEGGKAVFKMGHDARLRGILIRAHLMGVQVCYWTSPPETMHDPVPAMEVAARHGWEGYLESAVLRRDGKNRELLQRALQDPNLLKAGRWAYTGGQVIVLFKPDKKGMLDVMYVNQAGDIRRTRIPASEAPPAI